MSDLYQGESVFGDRPGFSELVELSAVFLDDVLRDDIPAQQRISLIGEHMIRISERAGEIKKEHYDNDPKTTPGGMAMVALLAADSLRKRVEKTESWEAEFYE